MLMGVAGEMSSMRVMSPRNGESHSVSQPIQFLPLLLNSATHPQQGPKTFSRTPRLFLGVFISRSPKSLDHPAALKSHSSIFTRNIPPIPR